MMNTGNMQAMMGQRGGAAGPQQMAANNQRTQTLHGYQRTLYHNFQQEQQQYPPGWRKAVDPAQRTSTVAQISSAFRLLRPMTIEEAFRAAMPIEKNAMEQSPDKEAYVATCQGKLSEIQSAREKQAANIESEMRFQSAQRNMGQHVPGQIGMPNNLRTGPFPQHFPNPQLQHAMQSTNLPNQQQAQQPFNQHPQNLGNMNMASSQFQMPPAQQVANPSQNAPRMGFTPEDGQQIQSLAQQLRARAAPEEIEQIKQRLHSTVTPEQKQQWQQQRLDPIMRYYINQAQRLFQAKKREAVMQQQQAAQSRMNMGMTTGPQPSMSIPQNTAGNTLHQFSAVSAAPGFNNTFNVAMQNIGGQGLGLPPETLRPQDQSQIAVNGHQKPPQQPQPGIMQPALQPNVMTQPNPPRANLTAQHMTQQEKVQHDARLQAHARLHQVGQGHPLQGQAGGLNGNMSQVVQQQSPAMPNLNRPLGPSMQIPQYHGPLQNRPQAPPSQPPPNNIMMGNQQQSQGQIGLQAAFVGFLGTLPPEMQQQYTNMSQDQKREFAQNWHKARMVQAQAHVAQSHVSPQIPVQTPGPNAPNFNSFNIGVSQPQDASQGMHGRGFDPQPQPQVPQQPLPGRVPQNPIILNSQQLVFMDGQPFPPNMINAQNMHRSPPPGVRLWRDLKSWVSQNINEMPNDILSKLKNLQAMHFREIAIKHQQQRQAPVQTPIQVQQPGPAPPAPMLQPRSVQPPTQMATGTPMPPNVPFSHPPSAEQLQAFRAQRPAMQHISDDNLKALIMRNRAENYRRQTMQQQAPFQPQRSQVQQLQKPAPFSNGQSIQSPPRKPPTPGQQPSAHAGGSQKAQEPLQTQTPRPPVRPLQNPQAPKGVKRSSDDTVTEIPNPRPGQPQQQQRKVEPPRKHATPSQKHQAPPQVQQQQGSQYEAELRDQAAGTGTTQQGLQGNRAASASDQMQRLTEGQKMTEKFHELTREVMQEYQRTPRQEVQMDPRTRSLAVSFLEMSHENLKKAQQATMHIFFVTRDQQRTKELIRLRLPILAQYRDGRVPQVADKLTLSHDELRGAFTKLFQTLKAAHSALSGQHPAATQQRMSGAEPSATTVKGPSTNSSQVAPNAKGRATQQPTPMQKSQRNARAPAAPTQDKPPFSFKHAQSPPPDGVPIAYGPNILTQDKLTLPPPGKKRKVQPPTGGSATTPGQAQGTPSSTASPKLSKSTSPRLSRSTAPASHFKCSEPLCERSAKGFATNEELNRHVKETHQVKEIPINNPLEWALEGIRISLGIDDDGRAKKRESEVKIDKLAPVAQAMKKSASVQSMTQMKMEGGTPMSRIPTQTGVQSNLGIPRTPQQSGATVKTPGSDVKSSVQKGGSVELERSASARKNLLTPPPDPWADLTISPGELSQYFPSPAELQGCSSLSSLTPDSTLSGSKSQDNSPKESDIAESDGLKIQIEMEPWLPPVFLADSLFPEASAQLGADDDLLGMDWDSAFGSTDNDTSGLAKQNQRSSANNISFDTSLFSFDA